MTSTARPEWRVAGSLLAASVLACGLGVAGLANPVAQAQDTARPAGWEDSTHGRRTAPDYDRLFAMDRVHELHITIAESDFRAMQADLAAVTPGPPPGMPAGPPGFGPPGAGGFGGFDQMAALMEASAAACAGRNASEACIANGVDGQCNAMFGGPLMCVPEAFANLMQGGALSLTSRDPMYVPVTVRHEGRTWTRVGMRYKGNSSLMAANMGGNGKIPFRLHFDRYEDEFPEIRNQRFHGFQRLTFSSNFTDDSQLHEVLATEILRDRGVPAARAAFYRVFVDVGAGAEYWGLYTMIEDPADGAMLDAQFGTRSGNLYKPDGPGANWMAFDRRGFENRTRGNPTDADDVAAAIGALHAPREDARAWRDALEKRFDVDLFLRWLAVNTALENWDAYGVMAHNYYLYGDPARAGRLQWIPWDHNMAFGVGPFGGGGPGRMGGFGRGGPGGPGGPPVPPFPPPPGGPAGAAPPGAAAPPFPPGFGAGGPDVLHERVGDSWPLIKLLLADAVYAARYRELLAHALGGLFAPDAFERRARELHTLIRSSVVGERGERPTHTTINSPEAFEGALDGPNGLLERVRRRHALIRTALDSVTGR
jgi:spore coat protein H